MMHSKLRHTMAASLLLPLLLGACGSDQNAKLESGNVASGNSAQSAGEQIEADAPSDLAESSGKVLLVKGYNLYSWQPAISTEEVLEVENIDPNQIYFTPDMQYLVYSRTSEVDRRQILEVEMMHMTSGIKTPLTRIEGRYARPAPNWWLQDAELERGWFILGLWVGRQETVLVKTDGSQRFDLGSTNNLNSIWLADGTLLGIEYDWNQEAQLNELFRVWHFDPAVGVLQEFDDLEVAAYQENWAGLVAALEERGVQFVEPPQDVANDGFFPDGLEINPVDGNWSDICNVWAVRDQATNTTIYENSDVAQISGVTPLADGSYIVAERTYTDCDFDYPTANLRRVAPGQEAILLSDTLDPGSEGFGFGQGWNMSVSPDGRYVLWVGGGVLTGESTLNLTDLSTNTTTVIRQVEFDIVADASAAESSRYKRVYWVPL